VLSLDDFLAASDLGYKRLTRRTGKCLASHLSRDRRDCTPPLSSQQAVQLLHGDVGVRTSKRIQCSGKNLRQETRPCGSSLTSTCTSRNEYLNSKAGRAEYAE